MTRVCAICERSRLRAYGQWTIHRPSLRFVCSDCRGTRAAHELAFPECVVHWHDGWDDHGDGSPWLVGSTAALTQWAVTQGEKR